MYSFIIWDNGVVAPRLYFSPSTTGKAYITLLKNGEVRLHSTIPAEINPMKIGLAKTGVLNQTYASIAFLAKALTDHGCNVTNSKKSAKAAPAKTYNHQQTKADYANTDDAGTLFSKTLLNRLDSISFIQPISNFTITVDTREPDTLLDMFSKSALKVRSEKLDVGDIRFTSSMTNDELIIERKTTSDLYSSIIAKTAHRQAECLYEYQQLKATQGIRVMVAWMIEGELNGERTLYNAFEKTSQTDGVINLFSGILGQFVFSTYGQHHLCYLAIKLCQGFFDQELFFKVTAAPRKSKSQEVQPNTSLSQEQYHGIRTSDKNPLMNILMAIPSLREPVAKAIIAKGHKLKDVLGYTESDWTAFEGVGRVTAKKIIEEISRF